MFEIKFHGIKIQLCFGFFAVTSLLLLDGSILPLKIIAVCLIHECGHLAAMKLFGMHVRTVRFYGGGICIAPRENLSLRSLRCELAVLAAGPAANITLAAGAFYLGAPVIGYVSLSMAVFSLLPLSSLDGGRMLIALACRFASDGGASAEHILRVTDIIFGAAAAAMFILRSRTNFTLPLTLAFMICGTLTDTAIPKGRHKAARR
ncbi:MAG: site-2 protease family protein [Huintestinicola sp.]